MKPLTTEEKLQHFYDLSIEAAVTDANNLISDHKAALDKLFADHKAVKLQQAETELQAESDKIKREFNKEISTKQIQIKRNLSARGDEFREQLFAEVEEKLLAFKQTPDYLSMLCRQIREALDFAGDDEMTIYIDPSDRALADEIVRNIHIDNFAPTISEESFIGGMRAVIRSKNILIDNSFLTLMKDEKDRFALSEVTYE